jgi:hypothetical protein
MAIGEDDGGVYTADERRLLETWISKGHVSREDEALLALLGFDHDPGDHFTRLDAWVGAFAVRDIQQRLPNFGIFHGDHLTLTRPIAKGRRSKRVAGAVQFLFRINWADSGPGFSWPADYHLVWLPGFDTWVLAYSADSPDALGYCDFALGCVGPADDWRAAVKTLLVENWRAQYREWEQAPWAQLWGVGRVSAAEALAWRREAWAGHEEFAEEEAADEDMDDVDTDDDILFPAPLVEPQP